MSYTRYEKFTVSPAVAEGNFPWEQFEDGWNGKSLKVNDKIKYAKNSADKVYSYEPYAAELYSKISGTPQVSTKEVNRGMVVNITDFAPLDENQVLATINNGASSIVIDLAKEQRFFNTLSIEGTGQSFNKDMFVECIKNDETKKRILSMNLTAKIGTDISKASIWDGYVEQFVNDMMKQINKNDKAYVAKIVSTNKGGFVVSISDIVKAFMPGSMAAANRITDFESMIGQTMEVMVESYDPNYGFVVSRKKFLRTMLPIKINELLDTLNNDQNTLFEGHVTGTTPFGIFVELNEYVTGMLHKSLVSDELREAMRNNSIEPGASISVYVHKIENNRVILSDVPTSERDAIIAKREAEDAAEKQARKASDNKGPLKQQAQPEEERKEVDE